MRHRPASVYRRVLPEADDFTEYHVAEIVERRYDSPEQAVQGLFRGEISLLPDLPTWAVSLVRNDQRFFVINYALPTTHVLQFNPHSEAASQPRAAPGDGLFHRGAANPVGNRAPRPHHTIRTTRHGSLRHNELCV